MASEQKYGLNKLKRLGAERAAAKEDLSSLLVQPDWPYQSQPFDPFFFGLEEAAAPFDKEE